MSEYTEIKTEFRDQKCLVEALMALGVKKEHIESHEKAQALYGFQNDRRDQKAEIIIRRKHVGGAANDVGFARQADGTFKLISSEYDRRNHGNYAAKYGGYNERFCDALKGPYSEKKAVKEILATDGEIEGRSETSEEIRLVARIRL